MYRGQRFDSSRAYFLEDLPTMGPRGIEPRTTAPRAASLPRASGPMSMAAAGIEPTSSGSRPPSLPLAYAATMGSMEIESMRAVLETAMLPLHQDPPVEAPAGIEPAFTPSAAEAIATLARRQRPRRESNAVSQFRKLESYPVDHEGMCP